MSRKSIRPLRATACYYLVDPSQNAEDKIRIFFSHLFSTFHAVDRFEALEKAATGVCASGKRVVVWDLRGRPEAFFDFLPFYRDRRAAPDGVVEIAICEENQSAKIIHLAREGKVPEYVLMVPWGNGVLQRVVEEVRTALDRREDPQSIPSAPIQLNADGNREYIEKLDAANAYYADRARKMQTEVSRMIRLLKTMTQDEEVRESTYLGSLIQYANVLRQESDALVEFARQSWHGYEKRIVFNINTVLDSIRSTSVPFLQSQGIELIFEVGNSVSARLKGYPLGLTNALMTALELLAHAKMKGELILRLSLEKEDGGEAHLHVQFMQPRYRGSVTNVVLSTIREDHQFRQLLKWMDEIEGVVYHTDRDARGDILLLSFRVETVERRSYRLPTTSIMGKKVLIIDDRKKNADVLQKMLRYFHIDADIAAQVGEAMPPIQDHEYDIVMVSERLVKRCAKSCKQVRDGEKFVVITSAGKEGRSNYFGLDMADSFLQKPFTHRDIFNALVNAFSDTNVEGHQAEIQTLREYLTLFVQHRTLLYVGSTDLTVHSIKVFLENTQMELVESAEIPGTAKRYDFVLIELDAERLRSDVPTIEHDLNRARSVSRTGDVVCIVPETIDEGVLERIAAFPFVLTYIQEPVDPDVFYKVMLDWAMAD